MGYGVVEQFIAGAKADLGDFVRESGVVLYSSPKTLKPGAAYLLGINPGADTDGLDDRDIETHLDKLPSTDINSYLDGEWDRGRFGQDPFQLRVVWLLRSLGLDPREVCASNLIFRRSDGQGDSGYPTTADRCWPVHQRILRIVQPKLIICLGNHPFDYIVQRAGYRRPPEEFPSGHGTWQCRAARVNIEGQLIDIISVPHFSRYKIIGKATVVEWIRKKLAARPAVNQEPVPTIQSRLPAPSPPLKSPPVLATPVAPTSRVEDYQVRWNRSDGYIILTGKAFSARGARGAAWETLRSRNGISVESWIPIAKRAGNPGCGWGDLEILSSDKWCAVVIVDSAGRQIHPPTTAPLYHKRPGR